MKEVITLQFGENANYVGTHYWNLQQKTIEGNADGQKVSSVLFTESRNVYRPRVLIFDRPNSFGWMGQERLSSAGQDTEDQEMAQEPWSGATEVYRQQLHPKQPFNAGTSPKSWSDFSEIKYSDRSLHSVSGVEFGNSLGEMETFQEGYDVFQGTNSREDILEGSFRQMAEECDQLQGFQILADVVGGFAGYSSAFTAGIRDEYPKSTIMLYNLGRTQIGDIVDKPYMVDAAMGLGNDHDLSLTSMTVPMFVSSELSKLEPTTVIAKNDLYQTSAFLAANIAQWSHCLVDGSQRRTLDDIVDQVTQQQRFPVAESFLAPGLDTAGTDGKFMDVVSTHLVSCSDAAAKLNQLGQMYGQFVVDRGPTGLCQLAVDIYPSTAYVDYKDSVSLPRTFPKLFGNISKQTMAIGIAGLLCSTTASVGYLEQLCQSFKTEQKSNRQYTKDYERDQISQMRQSLESLMDRYSE